MISDFENIPSLPTIFGPARQVSYVVDDIDLAIDEWQSKYGVGPFLVARNEVPLTNAFYRGNRAKKTTVNIAFAYVGNMQLELTQLVGNTPSMYLEAQDQGIEGVHHYAVCVEDFATAYNYALDNGYEAVIDAGIDGLARMSYVENRKEGLILEIIEWNEITLPFFDEIEKLVKNADKNKGPQEFKLASISPRVALLKPLIKFMINILLGRIETTRR